ncbi:hypothetical protein [Fictibacillus phosphorivorans]|uniref:hypothetical protein n=1 Tax=Fictibacillus phosphorivorans TaxID=1221500 RepID=UPI00203A509D|nr:hypothetical protein [Fictibacillus phosphorivorans]MCM3720035.1 hypothetical protein [Fictibacillus phosphorivorans]MCM3777695.1 hypothetical protein [Fictibacillus phosphorivorans]
MKHLAGILTLILLYGCSSPSPELESLMKEHPDIQNELNTLSDSELSEVKLPSHLPFKPDTISSNVEKDAELHPRFAEVVYHIGSNANLTVATYFNRVEHINPDLPSSFQLKDGSIADMRMNQVDIRELVWSDKKRKLTYKISLEVVPQTNNPWTTEDMLKIADSMK